MKLAPIAFFAYKRPEHTLKSLTTLSQCDLSKQSQLYIFCDAAKSEKDEENVKKVLEIAKSQRWCGKVEVIQRSNNYGLAKSIYSGVTYLCEKYGSVIVLEDDILVSPNFLRYVNTALEKYQHSEKVMQISGYMFPVSIKAQTDAIFLPITTTWGWATWQRAWKHYDSGLDGYFILKKDRKLRFCFNLYGSYPYFYLLMKKVVSNNKTDYWSINWYLNVFLNQGLTLYPISSLVKNIGFDGSGKHCKKDTFINIELEPSSNINSLISLPEEEKSDEVCLKKIAEFHSQDKRNLFLVFFQELALLWS